MSISFISDRWCQASFPKLQEHAIWWFRRHWLRNRRVVPSRTSLHFLQESVRFHLQYLGRQCIILAGILEDLGRKCLVLQDLARNVRILEVTWKKMSDLGRTWKKKPDLGSNLEENPSEIYDSCR